MALDLQTLAQRTALTAAHQLLLAARDHPSGSAEQLDCVGAATDIALMLEAYAHLWTPAN
jgi:hypothetical protein